MSWPRAPKTTVGFVEQDCALGAAGRASPEAAASHYPWGGLRRCTTVPAFSGQVAVGGGYSPRAAAPVGEAGRRRAALDPVYG